MGCGGVGDGVLKLGREFDLRQAVGCSWKGKRTPCSHQAPTRARPGQGTVGLGQDQCICVEGVKVCCWLGKQGGAGVTGISGAVPQLGLGAHSLLFSDQKAKLGRATRPSRGNS